MDPQVYCGCGQDELPCAEEVPEHRDGGDADALLPGSHRPSAWPGRSPRYLVAGAALLLLASAGAALAATPRGHLLRGAKLSGTAMAFEASAADDRKELELPLPSTKQGTLIKDGTSMGSQSSWPLKDSSWETLKDPVTGEKYFYDKVSGRTAWRLPRAPQPGPVANTAAARLPRVEPLASVVAHAAAARGWHVQKEPDDIPEHGRSKGQVDAKFVKALDEEITEQASGKGGSGRAPAEDEPAKVANATTTIMGISYGFLEEGVEYPGNDLETPAQALDSEECAQRCTAKASCFAWTWVKSARSCFLKGDHPRPALTRIRSEGRTSGMPTQVGRSLPRIERTIGQSVFCFSLVLPWGYERSLLSLQYETGASIFACDEYAVYSNITMEVAPGIQTLAFDSDLVAHKGGEFGTVLNTPIFMALWTKVVADGRFLVHDWTVKVDPDAVLFPDRLLQHLSKIPKNVLLDHSGGAWGHRGLFIKNCQVGLTMRGALEVISRSGVETYMKHTHECQAKNNPDGSGEDGFMHDCWSMIGVGKVFLPDLLRDQYCAGGSQAPSCNDGWAAAFHPMKHTWNWNNCFHIAAASR
uniref:WW domain-containing protein n=1 Tax=Pyrodinium bahamense TaxID=73915 RepID=A0A7S0B3I9_9DINO